MEDEESLSQPSSFRSDSKESVQFPVQGMESVVATVSGYHGSERFKLIKLISLSGASYIGAMNQSTTHLVCWKFEGRKYDLAKQFKMFIVNHRWVEECIKQGRRVPEQPYLLQSGKEIGPLFLDVPVVTERVRKSLPHHRDRHNNFKRSTIDIEGISDIYILGTRSSVANEIECSPSNNYQNINEKGGKSNLNHVCSSSRCYEVPAMLGVENEEPSSSSTMLSAREQRRSTTSVEPFHKRRRLVKKNVIEFVNLDSEQESRPMSVRLDGLVNQSNDSSSTREKKKLRSRRTFDAGLFGCGLNINTGSLNLSEVHSIGDSNIQSCVAPCSVERPSTDLCSNVNENLERSEHLARSPSTDLSCVICWTDFSATRGVLPCGHRFCFSCIQSWADVMVAMRKVSTCPLCKASFVSITKVDAVASSDQKIFSQTIPCDPTKIDIFVLPDGELPIFGPQPEQIQVCSECCCREPEDLLVRCHLCQIRCVHSYCLDPPLLPWTCIHCKDLQMLYRHLY